MSRRADSMLVVTKLARARVYLIALWKLARHPQTPRAARWLAFAVIAYAVSPIDLIPDFIPVLGLLDDLVIVPMGVALVVRLTPKPLWQSVLAQAEHSAQTLPKMWWGAALIALVWLLMLGLLAWWLFSLAWPK
jgi:uncharacterized membrane protein YkvA (DUF1232 family)